MRTIHWVALIGSIAAAVIACSSSDDGDGTIGPGKGGSAGGVVGKGGSAGSVNKGGSAGSVNNGGSTNEGGAAGQTSQGGAAGQTSQGGAAGSGTCDPKTQPDSDACSSCYSDACGTEAQACQGVAACGAIFTCLQACGQGDNACYTKCFTDNADGQQTAFAYLGCADATCHDDCYCAGTCGLATSNDTCNTCFHGNCGTECNGCDMNSDCMALLACMSYLGCGSDQTCLDGCAQQFQAGVAPINALNTCMSDKCATDCQ